MEVNGRNFQHARKGEIDCGCPQSELPGKGVISRAKLWTLVRVQLELGEFNRQVDVSMPLAEIFRIFQNPHPSHEHLPRGQTFRGSADGYSLGRERDEIWKRKRIEDSPWMHGCELFACEMSTKQDPR